MVIWYKKQTNWPYEQYYAKTPWYFYQKTRHVPEFEFGKLQMIWDDMNVKFIS